MSGASKYDGRMTPNDIIALCKYAKSYADSNIGYTIDTANTGTNCQTLVSQVTSGVSGFGGCPAIWNGATEGGDGWKVYAYGSQPKGPVSHGVWPGDVVAVAGKHTAIAIDWKGTLAEALNSGDPDPSGDLNGTTYELDKMWVITYIKRRQQEKAGSSGSPYFLSYEEKIEKSSAVPSEYYDLDQPENSLAKTVEGEWYYSWTKYGDTHYYLCSVLGKDEINRSTYVYYQNNGTPTGKWLDSKTDPNVDYYHRWYDEYYGFQYKTGQDGITNFWFWAKEGNQGGEVRSDTNISGNSWTLLARHVKSWVGIDYFSPNFVGKVYKIP